MTNEEFANKFKVGYPRTLRRVQFKLRDRSLAEEVASQTWTQAFLKKDQLELNSCFVTWVDRITANLLNNIWRKKRFSKVDLAEVMSLSNPESVTKSILARQLLSGCNLLEIELLWDKYVEELSYEEINSEHNLGVLATRLRIHRAIEKARLRML